MSLSEQSKYFFVTQFNESIFSRSGGENKIADEYICRNELSLSRIDPRIKECEPEVHKIIHL